MHDHGVVPLHEAGLPAAALEEHLRLFVGDAGEDGGVGDLKAVEVEDGQHRAVRLGIEELVGVPGGGQGAGLCLAVAHHAGGDQVGVIHDRAKGVGQGVAQLAALIDGAGGLGGHVAGDAAGEGELLEQLLHALGVPADVGVDLRIGAVQVVLGHHGVTAVAGAGEVDHVQVILVDDPVQVGVDEVLTRAGPPVAHDGALQVLGLQGLPQQGVVQQVELAGGQIVGCPPPGVDELQLAFGEGVLLGHAGGRFGGRFFLCIGLIRHKIASFFKLFTRISIF